MSSWNDVIGFLNYLGLTPHNIAPLLIVGAGILWVLAKKIDAVNDRIGGVEHSITELQTFISSKFKIQLLHPIVSKYGQSKSPIVLKAEFRDSITKTGIATQVKAKQQELLMWLKKQHPKTGLDAQDVLTNFVLSDEVSHYLDLTKYK